jgi:hypothetical protein
MIDPPRILETAAQPTAVIHITVPRAEIQKVMGPGIAEVRATLEKQGITPSGPWFNRHFRFDAGTFDFEVGVQGRRPAVWLWETYITDPSASPDPSTWQTDLNRPLIA